MNQIVLKLHGKKLIELMLLSQHIEECMRNNDYFPEADERLDELEKIMETGGKLLPKSPPYAPEIAAMKVDTIKQLCKKLEELACYVMLTTYEYSEEKTSKIIDSAGMQEKRKSVSQKPQPMFQAKIVTEKDEAQIRFLKWAKSIYIIEVSRDKKNWEQKSMELISKFTITGLPKGINYIRGKVIQNGTELFISEAIMVVVG